MGGLLTAVLREGEAMWTDWAAAMRWSRRK